MKTKLTLAEIGNPKNTITMMVDEKIENGYLLDDVMTTGQKKKLNAFEEACEYGWYSTVGDKRCEVFYRPVIDGTHDDNGQFRTGDDVYDGGENWIVYFRTNWQGQRDRLFLVPKSEYRTAEKAAEVMEYGRFDLQIWRGDGIF